MAKLTDKQISEGKETVEIFKDLDQTALNTERFIEKNSKLLLSICGGILVVVLGYFAYQQFVVAPKNEEATKAYLAAQKKLSEGNEAEALGGKSAANPGYLGTFNEFGGTAAGKLSAYNAGLLKFKEGKYQEAYDLLDAMKSDNDILMALKYGAMADCQANLNKAQESLDLLTKAAGASNDAYTQYYFTRKAGIMALALKKNAEAKKFFASIEEKYQEQDNGMSDSYIEMTKYY